MYVFVIDNLVVLIFLFYVGFNITKFFHENIIIIFLLLRLILIFVRVLMIFFRVNFEEVEFIQKYDIDLLLLKPIGRNNR